MSGLLRISDAASLAIHTMAILAKNTDRLVTTHEIATTLEVSENHLSKVCQRLTREGLIEAVRGPGGGMRLAVAAQSVSLLRVYETIEGPMKTDTCLLGRPQCQAKSCIMGGLVKSVNNQVSEYFRNTNLQQLADSL